MLQEVLADFAQVSLIGSVDDPKHPEALSPKTRFAGHTASKSCIEPSREALTLHELKAASLGATFLKALKHGPCYIRQRAS